jgi:heat shock protein HtpX
MKRIALLILTNLAVVLVLGTVASLLGANRYLAGSGLQLGTLLAFCFVFGFGGAFISLLISLPVAKWSTRAKVISGNEGSMEAWLMATVSALAEKAGVGMPQVAVYEGEANAFATGATRNRSLVAVSTGLLRTMDRKQVEAVLAHEIAHVANGDMVTLTLMQGVLNTFVMFLSRVIGHLIDRAFLKNDKDESSIVFTISVFVLDLVFGLVASMIVAAYSRHREYRADAGSAALLGRPDAMISALKALGGHGENALPKSLAAFGIAGKRVSALFASHPTINDRIAALQGTQG